MKILFFLALIAAGITAYYVWFEEKVETTVLLPSINRGPCETIHLRAANGQDVAIVAIHEMTPNGMTFSPLPTTPLIGSAKLSTVTTQWENVDVNSLSAYRDLYASYQKAVSGQTVRLKAGPHFYDLNDAMSDVRRLVPKVTIYFSDGSSSSCSMAFNKDDNQIHRVRKWSIHQSSKERSIRGLEELTQQLEPILYRSDVILFQNKLDRAQRAIRDIQTYSSTFNLSAALVFDEILNAH